MNLYLLHAPLRGYDTYRGAVVAAPDAETARTIHPNGEERWNGARWCVPAEWEDAAWTRPEHRSTTWVSHPDEVEVTLLGIAAPEYAHSGSVLLTDFFSG